MNKWKQIWYAYFEDATFLKLLKGVWLITSNRERLYLLMIIFGFLISLFVGQEMVEMLAVMIVFEGLIILKFEQIKNKMILDEYGGLDGSIIPDDGMYSQGGRYLIFKTKLKEQNISAINVYECFDLVDSQIEIASTNSSFRTMILTFIFGLVLGLFATMWSYFDLDILMKLSLLIIVSSLVVVMIISLIPSKLEKLKELRYFMLMYKSESKKLV